MNELTPVLIVVGAFIGLIFGIWRETGHHRWLVLSVSLIILVLAMMATSVPETP